MTSLPSTYTANNTCAEVWVAPSGRFLYGSNRGHDSIAIFAIDPSDGTLSAVGWQPTEGRTPRYFGLDSTATSSTLPIKTAIRSSNSRSTSERVAQADGPGRESGESFHDRFSIASSIHRELREFREPVFSPLFRQRENEDRASARQASSQATSRRSPSSPTAPSATNWDGDVLPAVYRVGDWKAVRRVGEPRSEQHVSSRGLVHREVPIPVADDDQTAAVVSAAVFGGVRFDGARALCQFWHGAPETRRARQDWQGA